MKRLFTLITTVVLLMVFNSVAFADTPDLSKYTDIEIIELMGLIQDEIISRHIQKTATFSKGTYLVGREIPAGSYIYTCLREDDIWSAFVFVYSDTAKETQLLSASVPKDQTTMIFLEEGNIIVSDEPFSLTISGGIVFK